MNSKIKRNNMHGGVLDFFLNGSFHGNPKYLKSAKMSK
jgi:hypothetical protein